MATETYTFHVETRSRREHERGRRRPTRGAYRAMTVRAVRAAKLKNHGGSIGYRVTVTTED
jgi:hypothetical protein